MSRIENEQIIHYAPNKVCGGNSPWKSDIEATAATLRLSAMGKSVAGLSREAVISAYNSEIAAQIPNNTETKEKSE